MPPVDERIEDVPEDVTQRPTVDELVTAWLLDHDVRVEHLLPDDPVPPEDTYRWASDVLDHLIEVHPDLAWCAIELAVGRSTDEQLGYIVAGPTEDLLSGWPELLPRVEMLVARDERFRDMLRGIYQLFMSDETYLRVRAASGDPVSPEELEERHETLGSAEERLRKAVEWQARTRARRLRHLANRHVDATYTARDGTGRTVYRLVPGATDQDARDVWCHWVNAYGGDPGGSVVVDARDRHRTWPEPRDCSDPNDVPTAVREASGLRHQR